VSNEQHPVVQVMKDKVRKQAVRVRSAKKQAEKKKVTLQPKEITYVEKLAQPGATPRTAAKAAGLNKAPSRPVVKDAVRRLVQAKLKQADLTVERVVLEIGRVALFDVRRLYDEDGQLLHVADLDEDTARALSGVKVDDLWDSNEEGHRYIKGQRYEYKTNKINALDMLMKYQNAYAGGAGQQQKDKLNELIAALQD
jgi:hypothetical protein